MILFQAAMAATRTGYYCKSIGLIHYLIAIYIINKSQYGFWIPKADIWDAKS